MKKILVLTGFILLMLVATDRQAESQNFNEYYNKLIEKFNDYSDKHILPKYNELKDAFEVKMEAKDKETMDRLRREIQTAKSMISSEQELYQDLRKSKSKVSRAEVRRYITDVRKHLNEIQKESHSLTQKYKPQLEESLKTLEKHYAKWSTGMDSVLKVWKKENKKELDTLTVLYGTIRMDKFMNRAKNLKNNIRTNVAVTDFMLWDGKFDLIMDNHFDDEEIGDKVKIVVMPNPFLNNCKIDIDIPKGENVDVSIINGQSQSIKELFKGKWESGSHQLDFDITKAKGAPLPEGAYYVKIASPSYVVTKMMVFDK